MVTADQVREEIRSPLALLLQHHVERGTPRMDAYGRVASLIGRSPAWVQRVIGRRPDTTVGLHDALNIRAAYERLCARVETAAERIEAENNQLREAIDVALSARATPVPSRPGAPSPQAAAPRGAGRPAAQALGGARARAPVPADQAPVGVSDLPLWRAIEGE